MKVRPITLVGRFVAAALVAGAIAAVAGTLLLRASAITALRSEIETRNLADSRSLNAVLEEQVAAAIENLKLVASRRQVVDLSPEAEGELRVVLRVSTPFEDLVLEDRAGGVIAAVSSRTLLDPATVSSHHQAPPTGEHSLSVINEGRPWIDLTVPVENPPGSVVGSLTGRIPLDLLAIDIESFRRGSTGLAFLADPGGTILVHRERDRVAAGERFPLPTSLLDRGGALRMEHEGEPMLVALSRNALLPLNVIVVQSESEALAPISAPTRQLTAILVAVIAGAVVAVSMLGRSLLRPLKPLSEAARRLGLGDPSARVPQMGRGEISVLTSEFNRMAEALQERLAELQASNRGLKQSEERFWQGFESAPIGMSLSDLSGSFIRVNRKFCEMLGRTEDELKLLTWRDVTHPDHMEADEEGGRRMITEPNGAYTTEKRYIHTDGSEVWVLLSSTVVKDEQAEPLYFFTQALDITERKAAEESLKRSERELRTLDDMKNSFLTAVSHELRTPLTSVLGFAHTLERQTDLSPSAQRDVVTRLKKNAEKLNSLLTDLLDLDRLRRRVVSPKRRTTDLSRLIHRTVETMEMLEARAVNIEVGTIVAGVDPTMVERIIENLIANAVKYTDPGAPIWIRAWAEGEGVVIAVEDAGSGIPDDQKETIFLPFRQGGDSVRHGGDAADYSAGVGIGLSLVAEFAGLHGGRAWVEDRPAGGSSFRVFLRNIDAVHRAS